MGQARLLVPDFTKLTDLLSPSNGVHFDYLDTVGSRSSFNALATDKLLPDPHDRSYPPLQWLVGWCRELFRGRDHCRGSRTMTIETRLLVSAEIPNRERRLFTASDFYAMVAAGIVAETKRVGASCRRVGWYGPDKSTPFLVNPAI